MRTFEKNQTGRPYSAPAVARPEFCYHSLQEDQILCTTLREGRQAHTSTRSQTLKIGDSLRISEPLQTRKPGLQLFLRQTSRWTLAGDILI